MCEDAPCCGCCGMDQGMIYTNEYALDDFYDRDGYY